MSDFWQAKVKRNPSYLNSLRTMCMIGMWEAPYALLALTAESILEVVVGVWGLMVSFTVFIIGLVSIIGAGLFGFLTPNEPSKTKETP